MNEKKEKQQKRRNDKPTVDHLVAPVFVKHNQEYGHNNDDTNHDCSVEN